MQNWNSVKNDELPQVGDEVLIKIPVNDHFNIESAIYEGYGVFLGCWFDRRGGDYCYKVDSWMKIPS